jgi:DNA-binding PadR family transcriptional regulator
MFDRGDLKFAVLRLVAGRPMHGYEVMRALEEESRGAYRPSPGSVYPTLQMLEDEGLLRIDESSGKKVYHITDEGRSYLERNRDVVDEVFDRVSDFTDRFFGEGMRDLSATFSKLAQATFEGAMRVGSDGEKVAAINRILDEALAKVKEAAARTSEERKR